MDRNLKSFGEQISTERRRMKLTQLELAELAGLSLRPIYLLETGKGDIRLGSLLKILHVLGMQVNLVQK